MITNLRIGYEGRLGNQMCQFGFLYALNKLYGYDIKIPVENTYLYDKNFCKLDIFSVFQLNSSYLIPHEQIKINKNYGFWGVYHNDNCFSIEDNSNVQGNLESSKYFYPHREELIKLYKFQSNIEDVASGFLNSINDKKELVCIHVRRGDYLFETRKISLSIEYYNHVISKYFNDKEYTFVIVTDDVEWCKTQFKNAVNIDDYNMDAIQKQEFYKIKYAVDMCILTKCKHVIASNSTFSWWGSFLNNNKGKVIIPKYWYVKENESIYNKGNILQDDLVHIFPDTIVIDNEKNNKF